MSEKNKNLFLLEIEKIISNIFQLTNSGGVEKGEDINHLFNIIFKNLDGRSGKEKKKYLIQIKYRIDSSWYDGAAETIALYQDKFLKDKFLSFINEQIALVDLIDGNEITETNSTELETIKNSKNKFLVGMPMQDVVQHFLPLTKVKSKNGNPFLTERQLNLFLKRAFLMDTKVPKQTFNVTGGDKGFVVLRFYEFFSLTVAKYNEYNRKGKYIELIDNNFTNWRRSTIATFFKSGRTKQKW